MLSSLYAIRRHGTSTRPWSSTSPSTSSCRWCSARRSCTPTTSSSSRWLPSDAIQQYLLHLTTYCRTVTLTVTTRTPTPALHLGSPAPPSGGKNLFSQKVHGSTLELAASQKHGFLRPRNVANFAKVAIFVAVKMSKGRSQQDILCHGILWTESTSPLADHFYEYHRPMLPTFPRESWQIVAYIDFSALSFCFRQLLIVLLQIRSFPSSFNYREVV